MFRRAHRGVLGTGWSVNNPLVVLAAVETVFPSFTVRNHFTRVIFFAGCGDLFF